MGNYQKSTILLAHYRQIKYHRNSAKNRNRWLRILNLQVAKTFRAKQNIKKWFKNSFKSSQKIITKETNHINWINLSLLARNLCLSRKL